MEDQVEGLLPAVLAPTASWISFQDSRPQLDVPGLVHAVHIAECGRQHVPAAFAEAKRLGNGKRIRRRAVKLLVDLADDAVPSPPTTPISISMTTCAAAHCEELGGDLEVLSQRHRGAVPHVGLEERLLTAGDALDGDLHERAHEPV